MNRRRLLWCGLTFVVWNAMFDLQVRWAGHRFVATQVERVSRGQGVMLIAEGFQPAVRRAAVVSTVGIGLLLAGAGLTVRRRSAW